MDFGVNEEAEGLAKRRKEIVFKKKNYTRSRMIIPGQGRGFPRGSTTRGRIPAALTRGARP